MDAKQALAKVKGMVAFYRQLQDLEAVLEAAVLHSQTYEEKKRLLHALEQQMEEANVEIEQLKQTVEKERIQTGKMQAEFRAQRKRVADSIAIEKEEQEKKMRAEIDKLVSEYQRRKQELTQEVGSLESKKAKLEKEVTELKDQFDGIKARFM